MARGSIQPRHQKGCPAKGKDNRVCRCAPSVYAVLGGQWAKIGYLSLGWRKSDLAPFDTRLAEMRAAREGGGTFKPNKALRTDEYGDAWLDELYVAADAGHISKLTFNTYERGPGPTTCGPSSGRCCWWPSTVQPYDATRRRSRLLASRP
jgi:hypothetical protein